MINKYSVVNRVETEFFVMFKDGRLVPRAYMNHIDRGFDSDTFYEDYTLRFTTAYQNYIEGMGLRGDVISKSYG